MICASSVLSIFVRHTAASIDNGQFEAFLHKRNKIVELLLSYEDICNFSVAIYSSKNIDFVEKFVLRHFLQICRIHCILRHFSLGCDNYFNNNPVDDYNYHTFLTTRIAAASDSFDLIPRDCWLNLIPQAGSLL